MPENYNSRLCLNRYRPCLATGISACSLRNTTPLPAEFQAKSMLPSRCNRAGRAALPANQRLLLPILSDPLSRPAGRVTKGHRERGLLQRRDAVVRHNLFTLNLLPRHESQSYLFSASNLTAQTRRCLRSRRTSRRQSFSIQSSPKGTTLWYFHPPNSSSPSIQGI